MMKMRKRWMSLQRERKRTGRRTAKHSRLKQNKKKVRETSHPVREGSHSYEDKKTRSKPNLSSELIREPSADSDEPNTWSCLLEAERSSKGSRKERKEDRPSQMSRVGNTDVGVSPPAKQISSKLRRERGFTRKPSFGEPRAKVEHDCRLALFRH